MRILIVPDVHLKPCIYDMADEIAVNKYDAIACLGDVADDWGADVSSYTSTYVRAIAFAEKHKNNIFWCYGNHDISYIFSHRVKLIESGYNYMASEISEGFLGQLKEILGANLRVIHRIDNTLISHAGLTEYYARYIMNDVGGTIEDILDKINAQIDPNTIKKLWNDSSPIWARPQIEKMCMYKDFYQVVGHTPVRSAFLDGNILSLDVFSTDRHGLPIGNKKLYIVDTETLEYQMAN